MNKFYKYYPKYNNVAIDIFGYHITQTENYEPYYFNDCLECAFPISENFNALEITLIYEALNKAWRDIKEK